MFTTRTVDELGQFGKKTRILDDMKTGEVKNLREAICKIVNAHAEKLGSDFYVYAGKFLDIDPTHIPTKHIPIQSGKEYRAGAARLLEGVDPEAGEVWHLEREVHLEVLFQFLALVVVHDVVDEGVNFPVIQGGQIDLANLSVNPDHRRNPGGEV